MCVTDDEGAARRDHPAARARASSVMVRERLDQGGRCGFAGERVVLTGGGERSSSGSANLPPTQLGRPVARIGHAAGHRRGCRRASSSPAFSTRRGAARGRPRREAARSSWRTQSERRSAAGILSSASGAWLRDRLLSRDGRQGRRGKSPCRERRDRGRVRLGSTRGRDEHQAAAAEAHRSASRASPSSASAAPAATPSTT